MEVVWAAALDGELAIDAVVELVSLSGDLLRASEREFDLHDDSEFRHSWVGVDEEVSIVVVKGDGGTASCTLLASAPAAVLPDGGVVRISCTLVVGGDGSTRRLAVEVGPQDWQGAIAGSQSNGALLGGVMVLQGESAWWLPRAIQMPRDSSEGGASIPSVGYALPRKVGGYLSDFEVCMSDLYCFYVRQVR